MFPRPSGLAALAAVALSALTLGNACARAQDHVTFGLDWKAEAEYGGYYEALATGLYRKAGLDVTIRQGGPQLNQAQLLLTGRLDFAISSNSFLALNFASEGLPFVCVAAIFQKDPAVLIAHPGQGDDSFAALKGKPIMLGADSRAGWWNFLKAKFGYTDAQIRPYTFNLQPFLANPRAIQQGYLGSEPFTIEQEGHFKPVVLLLADAGFQGYGQLIATSRRMGAQHADIVRRFLDATRAGWRAYLEGNPAPGNAAIKRANPEMTDALLAYGRAAMIRHGIVLSGDALTMGIGAMTPARWNGFARQMEQAGLYKKNLDVSRAYTLRFLAGGAR